MRALSESFSKCQLTAIAAFILISDQISKLILVNYMTCGDSRRVFSFFNIVRVENRGITFGIFSGIHPVIFVLLSLTIVVLLMAWTRKERVYRLPVAIVVAGAVGNTLDRMLYGAVIDFLDFHVAGYHWPAFNIADSSVVIGVFVMFYFSFYTENAK